MRTLGIEVGEKHAGQIGTFSYKISILSVHAVHIGLNPIEDSQQRAQ